MAKNDETTKAQVDEVEFVPSAALVDEVEFVPSAALVEAIDPGATAPAPEMYRELRPWSRETLAEQLNAAAADGWKLAAVVGSQIILERAR